MNRELKLKYDPVGRKGNLLSIGQVFLKYDLMMHSVNCTDSSVSRIFCTPFLRQLMTVWGLPDR